MKTTDYNSLMNNLHNTLQDFHEKCNSLQGSIKSVQRIEWQIRFLTADHTDKTKGYIYVYEMCNTVLKEIQDEFTTYADIFDLVVTHSPNVEYSHSLESKQGYIRFEVGSHGLLKRVERD